ncbi:hypothetical protein IFM89_008678 [Coptis chinensis]|uniref:Uncharacterized protein n=1 Tax=Coptis chinensis TaxID=261450 RepID=A0A835GWT3_9MAGN|nr:hypothetical protein IFM89_008678 [Coptis chinensis]
MNQLGLHFASSSKCKLLQTQKEFTFSPLAKVATLKYVKCTKNPSERDVPLNTNASGKMGVKKQVLKAGNGPKPVPGQSVTVHCTGFGKNEELGVHVGKLLGRAQLFGFAFDAHERID